MKELSIQFLNLNLWITLSVIIVLIVLYLSFRSVNRTGVKRSWIVLLFLRVVLLLTIITLILNPLVRWKSTRKIEPEVLFWIDNSRSISAHRDFHPDSLLEEIKNASIELKNRGINVKYLTFSRDVEEESEKLGKVEFKGGSTNISNLIKKAESIYDNRNVKAAFLVSDGVSTEGEDPLLIDINLPFPVFTIGIGDSVIQSDPHILTISSPQTAVAGDTIEIISEIVPLGDGTPIEILLKKGGDIIQKKVIETYPEVFSKEVKFQTVADEPGIVKYEVEIISKNDVNLYNNRMLSRVRINQRERNIVIISSRPGFDLKFLKISLETLDRVKVFNFIDGERGWIPEHIASVIDREWDVVALIGYPSEGSNINDLRMIREKIENEMPGIILMDDMKLSLKDLSFLIGDEIVKWEIAPEIKSVPVQLTSIGRDHPVICSIDELSPIRRTGPSSEKQAGYRDELSYLPPIGWRFKSLSLVDGFIPILRTADISESPVIALIDRGNSRLAACFGLDFWRWHFVMKGIRETDLYTKLFSGIASWVSDTLSTSNLQISINKPVVLSGEILEISGLVYDLYGNLLKFAAVNGKVVDRDGKEKLFIMKWDGSKYSSDLVFNSEGEYKIKVEAYLGESKIGEAYQDVTVVGIPIELTKIIQRADVLRSISFKTGGEKIDLTNISKIAQSFDSDLRTEDESHEIRLSRWGGLFAFLILLLIIDWIVRKLWGYH